MHLLSNNERLPILFCVDMDVARIVLHDTELSLLVENEEERRKTNSFKWLSSVSLFLPNQLRGTVWFPEEPSSGARRVRTRTIGHSHSEQERARNLMYKVFMLKLHLAFYQAKPSVW